MISATGSRPAAVRYPVRSRARLRPARNFACCVGGHSVCWTVRH